MKKYRVVVNGVSYEVELEAMDSTTASESVKSVPVTQPTAPAPVAQAGGQNVCAPMPGNILAVNVSSGQSVKAGQILFILEAMKMENEILSPCDGTIGTVAVTKGQAVDTNALLCSIG